MLMDALDVSLSMVLGSKCFITQITLEWVFNLMFDDMSFLSMFLVCAIFTIEEKMAKFRYEWFRVFDVIKSIVWCCKFSITKITL